MIVLKTDELIMFRQEVLNSNTENSSITKKYKERSNELSKHQIFSSENNHNEKKFQLYSQNILPE